MINIILCGGAGSRLWPLSRQTHPKPFLSLNGQPCLMSQAVERSYSIPDTDEVIIVTNKELRFTVDACLPAPPPVRTSYLLEPVGRNTGPAIAVASLLVARRYGDAASVLVLSADHIIDDSHAFLEAVHTAEVLAREGKLVTFGIKPTRPETGFGYIETQGQHVLRFVEKPPQNVAEQYINAGTFLWNAGIFCFTAGTMLEQLELHAPELLRQARQTLLEAEKPHSIGNKNCHALFLPESFSEMPNISIDYAIMEKSRNVSVVPCDIGWRDIGSWPSLFGQFDEDDEGNSISGATDVICESTSSCCIHGEERLIATLGVSDLLIVDTADALLVADKSHSQQVKDIYERLAQEQRDEYKFPRTVHRPWGKFTLLESTSGYKIKRLVVTPGQSLSCQMHKHRNEHWVVVTGTAQVTCGDEVFQLSANESTYIKAGCKHSLSNPGEHDLVIIEIQMGSYLGEDDIIRFSDEYGRTD